MEELTKLIAIFFTSYLTSLKTNGTLTFCNSNY